MQNLPEASVESRVVQVRQIPVLYHTLASVERVVNIVQSAKTHILSSFLAHCPTGGVLE